MKNNHTKRLFSIRTTLLTTIFSLCLIPLVIISTVFIVSSSRATNSEFVTNSNTLNHIAMSFLDEKLAFYASTLGSTIEHENFDKSADPGYHRLREKLKTLTKGEPSLLNIYFCSEEDDFVQVLDGGLPADFKPTELSWYQDSIASKGEITFHEPYVDEITGGMTFSMYKAIEKNGKYIGVLAIDVSLASLSPQLEAIRYGTAGQLIVTDESGSVVISPDHETLGTLEPTEYSTWEEIAAQTAGTTKFIHNDISYSAVYNTSSTNGWKFILKIPTSELTSKQYNYAIFAVISMVLAGIICAFIIFILTTAICNSINTIKEFIEDAANGIFSNKLTMKTYTLEFKLLADHLNKMQENIAHIMNEFHNSIEDITTHTENSLDESKTVALSIHQISDTMSEIAQGTTESANNLENINTHMEQLSANMDQIKLATENVNAMALKTSDLGQSGSDISKTVKLTSTQTKSSTLEVTEAIKEVADKIEAISIMSATISNITEQTNLLALNATIEAARAGEAGKGFAVVASEISKLADETAISAQKINEVVVAIEHFVSKAVEKVTETSQIVDSQEEAVEKSQVIFADIVASVNALSEKVGEIATELTGVNQMKNDVLEQVEGLSSILEETAAGTEEAASSASVVQDSASQFVNTLSNLSTLSEDLREHINKFSF